MGRRPRCRSDDREDNRNVRPWSRAQEVPIGSSDRAALRAERATIRGADADPWAVVVETM